jgi:phosphatidylinositol alpha-1,6-mannosyltransferase
MAPLAAIVARGLGVPLWLQLHGTEAWEPLGRWQRRAAERASLVTAVSRFTRARFLSCTGLDPARVRVLPNTFDASFAPGPKPQHLIDRHALGGRKVLLTLGRLAPDERRKGQDQVIRALPEILASCPEAVYVVAGTGHDRDRLESLARRLGVERAVAFVGRIAPAEIADYYRAADVFVMPSTQEGFGIVFLEAAACGVPLVGGNRDGSTDALADGAIGSAIDPENAGELAAAVLDAIAGRGPRPAAVARFRFENFADAASELAQRHLIRRGTAAA